MEATTKQELMSKSSILAQVEEQLEEAIDQQPPDISGYFVSGAKGKSVDGEFLYTGVLVLSGPNKQELEFIGNYIEELVGKTMHDVDFSTTNKRGKFDG
jgi:hypothetical protein